ncbi:uncharacterized protein Z518_11013 [Rhinocladiella mackenziei CBS 650.93]|uniref:Rhinocladiella mackenziei CBS 650.93 unplaced genomic scaffold supercont1.11, whole genome shotgun sequence n=1 Tax=Rhinocladiella mackenziei CBS 650.93 TaxID=1442369 RepID=A0A0D2I8P7_9EURO|nr:uncharacterized protein Z518_11013 [Rhinocladiella mackenziei CBS 650.93]KIW99600.1 hypothetical protein Z518_11013 [Rhinocladiella mackenziei CBS 650.93]
MPIYHVVLFKLKPGVTPAQISNFTTMAKGMVGKIPGLLKLDANTPLLSTAHRGKGFNMGLIAILEKADDVKVYAEHPAHLEVQSVREAICDDTLAYDLEYSE